MTRAEHGTIKLYRATSRLYMLCNSSTASVQCIPIHLLPPLASSCPIYPVFFLIVFLYLHSVIMLKTSLNGLKIIRRVLVEHCSICPSKTCTSTIATVAICAILCTWEINLCPRPRSHPRNLPFKTKNVLSHLYSKESHFTPVMAPGVPASCRTNKHQSVNITRE